MISENAKQLYDLALLGVSHRGAVLPILPETTLIVRMPDGEARAFAIEPLLRDELRSFDEYEAEEGFQCTVEAEALLDRNGKNATFLAKMLDAAHRSDMVASFEDATPADYEYAIRERQELRDNVAALQVVVAGDAPPKDERKRALAAIAELGLRIHDLTRALAQMQPMQQAWMAQRRLERSASRRSSGVDPQAPASVLAPAPPVAETVRSLASKYERAFTPPETYEEAYGLRNRLARESHAISAMPPSIERTALQRARGRESYEFNAWMRDHAHELPSSGNHVWFRRLPDDLRRVANAEFETAKAEHPEIAEEVLGEMIRRLMPRLSVSIHAAFAQRPGNRNDEAAA